MSPLTENLTLPTDVLNTLQHASSLDEISQYYVFLDKQSQLELIVCDSPGDAPSLDPELPLSGKNRPLQIIFSVRASGKPNYLEARVLFPTHWDLDLLEDYEDCEDELTNCS